MATTTSLAVTTTTSASRPEPSSPGSEVIRGIYNFGLTTGAGALAGWMFSLINPVGGAVFGASMALTQFIGNTLADKLLMDKTAAKIAAKVISLIAGVVAGFFAVTTLGFSITAWGAVGMALAAIITTVVINCLLGGAGCCAACLGGLGLALRERV